MLVNLLLRIDAHISDRKTVIKIERSAIHLPVLAEKKSFLSFSHLSSMREKVSDRYNVSCECKESRRLENKRDFLCSDEMAA